jgi:hypothetical protein
MIVVSYKPNETKEYKIIRDYYTYYKKREGVLFVLANEMADQTFSKFLPREQMNNTFEWEKVREGDVHYRTAGVESGEESKLIIETGFIKVKKPFGKKVTTYTYKKYRFMLKNK